MLLSCSVSIFSGSIRRFKTYGVVWLNERVVDGNDVDIAVLDTVWDPSISRSFSCMWSRADVRVAEDDTANTAKTVDTDLQVLYEYVFSFSSGMAGCLGGSVPW